jgi:hypothetical protein
MEPYKPGDVPRAEPAKKYEPSEWAKKMTKVGCDQVREHGRTSGSFNAEMAKHLKTEVPKKIAQSKKGGIYVE